MRNVPCVRKTIFVAFLWLIPIVGLAAGDDDTVETPRLVVRDAEGVLSRERLDQLAHEADTLLLDVLKLWSADAKVEKFGKIRMEFHNRIKNTACSVFSWSQEGGRKVRVVRVYGIDGPPQEMAHKLTHAVFPSKDKMIRNMMGIVSEIRLGNPDSFPMCGFSADAWVQAIWQLDQRIPLRDLGPDHRDWGMEFLKQKPVVKDRARQHAAYVQVGSFGDYLFRNYGVQKVKTFHRLSKEKERPWEEAFGRSLEALESEWSRYILTELKADEKTLSVLKQLRSDNPKTACDEARSRIAAGKQPDR